MTALQRLQIEQSEKRQRVHVLLEAGDAMTDEQRGELGTLTTRMQTIETELRAAIIAEPTVVETRQAQDDGEAVELRSIRHRVELRNYVNAAVERRGLTEGAELEYNQALGIGANRFPLRMLVSESEHRETTDAETTATARRWVDRLFSVSAAARVGVTFETVAPGLASYPILTAGATGKQRARGQDTGAAAWTMGATELKPTRHSVHAVFSREDDLRVPGLQDALMRDLRMALMDSLDQSVFTGDSSATGTDYDITGLQAATDVVEKEITQANKVKGKQTLTMFAELVDGKHAERIQDLMVVASVGSNVLWLTEVINSAAENQTLGQFLAASGLSWMTRAGIESNSANGDFGGYIGRARGIEGAGVAPVWEDGQLIVDPYTGAKAGEVQLSMNTYWNFGLVRPTNFARIKYVT